MLAVDRQLLLLHLSIFATQSRSKQSLMGQNVAQAKFIAKISGVAS